MVNRFPQACALVPAILSLALSTDAFSQAEQPAQESGLSISAAPAEGEIVIDGRLDEAGWQRAEVARGFVQQSPQPGEPATERTEVRVLYDDRNLYVGMRMYDSNPDRIAAQLGRRDATGLYSDWAHVVIDSYDDRRTAFRFSATPAGVQRDVLHFADTEEDDSWRTVWEVATHVDSLGWTAEFRIPLSQLRFRTDGEEELVWGINFIRDIARRDERSLWAPIAPDAGRFVSRFGRLTGLEGVPMPRRIELTPYTLARVDWVPGDAADPFRAAGKPGMEAGLDLTYGIGPTLTLTAAINPDFGQVEVDPAVVNLTAFETFFPERRPFFLEGADIFEFDLNFGDGGEETLFYTRRIGRAPQGGVPGEAVYADAPAASRILGAAKLSGRTGGWSIGALNAVTAQTSVRWVDDEGTIRDSAVEPLTNYGVLRASRDFRDGQSAVGGMLTTVHRDLSAERLEFLPGAAYTGGLDFRHRYGDGDWQASGWLAGSHVAGTPDAIARVQQAPGRYFQRPDADHVTFNPERTSLSGAGADLTLARISGPWRGGGIVHLRSPGFEVNDLGFQQNTDAGLGALWIGRVSFEPGRYLRNWNVFSNLYGGWTWGGERFIGGINASSAVELQNGWGGSGFVAVDFPMLDPVGTRGGPALHRPMHSIFSSNLYSDRRRPTGLELNLDGLRDHETGGGNLRVAPALSFRPAPSLGASIGPSWTRNTDAAQYVGREDVEASTHHLFGEIEQTTLSVDARLNVTFTPQLSLEFFAQPFVSVGRYSAFRRVDEPRALDFADRYHTFAPGSEIREVDEVDGRTVHGVFPGGAGEEPAYTFTDPGFHIRSLRGNAALRWEYRPGSTIYLVWQQDRSGAGPAGQPMDLRREAGALFDAPGQHVLLIKATYWFGG